MVISPSAATWVVDTILRATLIEGDPRNLIDGHFQQFADEVDSTVINASALIENVISIIEGTDTIYELSISEETLQGQFVIPYKTKLVEFLSQTDQIITVDSTIGWPERNGTIRINDEEVVQYKERSLNQFIECTRSKNGIVEDWDPGTLVYSTSTFTLIEVFRPNVNSEFLVLLKQEAQFLMILVLTTLKATN